MAQNTKKIITAIVVAVLAIAIGYKMLQPDKEAQRAAIASALSYDDKIGGLRSSEYLEDAGFLGSLLGDSQAAAIARRKYVARLRSIPLDGCPSDFKKAYRDHIKAWEADDSDAISRTWDRVIWTAYDYGIAAEE